jgi:fructokinase
MITVCGEALIDLVNQGGGRFQAHPGGSPANVAVGLSRLGAPVALLARVSSDAFGQLLQAHLHDNGVDPRHLMQARERTTLAVVSLDENGVATYDFYVEGTADWHWQPSELPDPLPDDVTALHSGSLALAVEPGASLLTGLLRRERNRGQVTISIDPNIRPTFEPDRQAALRRVEEQVRFADVVKVSAEDLRWLVPGESAVECARRWQAMGPAVVVVTLGSSGAVAIAADGIQLSRPSVPVAVVDTVGAGDAFTAGMLDAMRRLGLLGVRGHNALRGLSAQTLGRIVDEGMLVAALTCGRAGANPPTWAEVQTVTAEDENEQHRAR